MTTQLSREELKQELIKCDQNASGMFEVGEDAMCAMMAMLQEGGSEPVGYRYRFVSNRGCPRKWILVDTIDQANPLPNYEVQPVYAHSAPPAPVAVPDAMTPEMIIAVQRKTKLGAYAAANLAGAYGMFDEFWQVACRAAMLNGNK